MYLCSSKPSPTLYLGTIDEVKDVVYISNKTSSRETHTSLKFTQTYDPEYHGRYHSEVTHTNAYKLGDRNMYYGFTFRLSKNWVLSTNLSVLSSLLMVVFMMFYTRNLMTIGIQSLSL